MTSPTARLADLRHEFGEHGGVNRSIEASTTFTVLAADTMPEIFRGARGAASDGCYLYGRHFNPTVYALGRELAALEGTEAGYATASGMSAIAATLMQVCAPGDHIVASNVLYGGSFALLNHYLPTKCSVSCSFVDITDLAAVEAAFTERTRVLHVESMGNPLLVVADIPLLAQIAHRHRALLIVDNTFCPLLLSPAQLGADIVVHSMTKFLSGAADVIAGGVCASRSFIESLMDVNGGALMLMGPTMDPKVAFELSLRLPHLELRMREHCHRAQVLAERLAERGMRVIYPGLTDHPQHALLRQIGNTADFRGGGLLGVDLGSTERASRFMEALQNEQRFGYIAVSLGYFDTLMSCSSVSTSSEIPAETQRSAGIPPGLVRISIGYTGDLEQRWQQLKSAVDGIM